MLGNPNGKFETLVTKLLSGKQYEKALQQGIKLYQINQYHITELVPNKIVQMYYLITTKFYYNRLPGDNQSWYENQLRVFIWLLVGYAYLQTKHISELGQKDWTFFSSIFNHRNPDIFQFQSKTILKKTIKCTRWQSDEVDLLDSLIKSKSIKNKWNQIAKELFIISNKKYFRTAKQCRQHWINHLNPNTVRASWTAQEDLHLVQAILKYGKKWSKVSKILGGKRTEHMVKNRFKSLFHFESKKIENRIEGRELEIDIIEGMIFKIKRNIEQGNKLSQILQNKNQGLKVEGYEEDRNRIYEEEDESNINLGLPEKFIYKDEEYEDKKNISDVRSEEDQIEEPLHPRMTEFLQQDCINIFFHESYMFQR